MGGGNLVDTRCYIDGRVEDISSPTELAYVLLQTGLPQLVRQVPEQYLQGMHSASNSLIADFAAAISVLKVKGGLNRVIAAISFNAPQLYAPAEISMATVLKAYSDVLDAWDQARATGKVSGSSKWPLLVIDEANKLMAWQGHYDTELQQLLSFFVAITKANNRSHVMLATSEYGFLAWLNKGTPALLQARVPHACHGSAWVGFGSAHVVLTCVGAGSCSSNRQPAMSPRHLNAHSTCCAGWTPAACDHMPVPM